MLKSLTIEERIEAQKKFLEILPLYLGSMEQDFWDRVVASVQKIRNTPGSLESRLQMFVQEVGACTDEMREQALKEIDNRRDEIIAAMAMGSSKWTLQ